ncbi:hypothetical protein SAMN05421858_1261 [Haladaptatus litoreus]|uniref:CARDB protein n=1 Tax=Haladaptatus litoreus TaxID=553468 RepID=A0A1N6XSX3_9EURY|nr:hypothetical protein [Haladaptatus litoreus]SIR05430.1 hypothetical protein SAMN05421858_1261 [Haladaptatus litoreus]
MQGFRFGLVFVVVTLVVAPMAGVAQATDGTQSSQLQQVGQQTGQQQSQQANQSQQTNATSEPALVENETVSLAGVPLHIEEGLLTLRNGTLALFVKRGAVTADGTTAVVTNTRIALGDNVTPSEANRTRQALEDGRLAAPSAVSNARIAAGLLSVETNGVAFTETNVSTNVGSPTVPPGRAIAGPVESPFEVTNLGAPETVPVGQSFNVSATVRNPGNRTGTEELQYRAEGITAQRQTVTLGANESRTVTFEVSSGTLPSEPGTYSHGVYAFDSNQTASISLTGGNQSNQTG